MQNEMHKFDESHENFLYEAVTNGRTFTKIEPGSTSLTKDEYEELFDQLMNLCERTYNVGLFDLSIVLEISLDACLFARDSEFPTRSEKDLVTFLNEGESKEPQSCSDEVTKQEAQELHFRQQSRRMFAAARNSIRNIKKANESKRPSLNKGNTANHQVATNSDNQQFMLQQDHWEDHTWQFEIENRPFVWASFATFATAKPA